MIELWGRPGNHLVNFKNVVKDQNDIDPIIDLAVAQMNNFEKDFVNLLSISLPAGQKNDELLLNTLKELLIRYPANPVIIFRVILFLYLLEDNRLVEQTAYDLNDIERLLKLGAKTYENDFDINIEYYFFLKNIRNDDQAAAEMLNDFKRKIIDRNTNDKENILDLLQQNV